ncbi:sialate O-acetylesterase [Niabella insulamsoli]|uniref:sialate O-acetylesterase n=1 Tax=Niabella insulamsoli TaxID=3144874 RepID=UPI0031FDC09A
MKKIIFFLFVMSLFSASMAQLRLPALFSDSMVLQQRSAAPVWGWASPQEKIEVAGSWSSKKVSATADANGKWMVKLSTPAAGGPYEVVIRGRETKTLKGVLIGEVWICSGQSNMEMPVEGWANDPIQNAASEIAQANFPSIRFFTVQKQIAYEPLEDVVGSWSSCNPVSVRSFSATAYFFARELYRKLKVPIALIHTSWGGTVAEAWASKQALKTMGDFNQALQTIDSVNANLAAIKTKDSIGSLSWQKALADLRQTNVVTEDEGEWKPMQVPTFWEDAGLPNLDAVVWFKKTVDIPQNWVGKDLKLDLGPIDDRDITFVNGKLVDSTTGNFSWGKERHYTIPAALVKAGANTITVCVIDDGGNGGLYGSKEKLKIYPAERMADAIGLDGTWLYKIAAVKPQQTLNNWPNQPSVLYNGMIAPLIPFAIRGAIWYQGESNVGRAKQYTQLFPLMINDWRQRWNDKFPFYFVQIAPFNYGGEATLSAALRDAQRRTLTSSPQTGMAVTLDIGNPKNIHPANKQEVGRRLALWALHQTYQVKDVVPSGPLYLRMEIKNNQLIISFDHTEGGLNSKSAPLEGFELKGKDGEWKPATAVIEGNRIILSNKTISQPEAARYAYYNTSVGTLFNGAGLPAATFTTEPL